MTFENGFLIFSWFHAENHLDLFQLCRKLFWKLPLNMKNVFIGVTSLLTLKRDEFLVGSGDGNVCLVVDQTTKPSRFKKPVHDGIPKQITEPTKNCLTEVSWGK